MKGKQTELFNDFNNGAQVVECVAGFYVGKIQEGNEDDPVKRYSDYYSTHEQAHTALHSKDWTKSPK